ncbi:MAG: DinB family protein [Firmicutes bacterium]|nr:DinB family protein [Bacillota bacterium]
MSRALVQIINEKTTVLFHNVETMLQTCDLLYILCDMPIWKHAYHMLHSCDRWFINPEHYTEPAFHEPDLNSLDVPSEKALSRELLLDYLASIKAKVMQYLEDLTDERLAENPEDCPHSRLALILGQYRHVYAHLGNINATTIIQTGRWPRVVGLEGDLSKGLYE